jgi:hypothetical protein
MEIKDVIRWFGRRGVEDAMSDRECIYTLPAEAVPWRCLHTRRGIKMNVLWLKISRIAALMYVGIAYKSLEFLRLQSW